MSDSSVNMDHMPTSPPTIGRSSRLTKQCRRNTIMALGILGSLAAVVLWRDSHADALLTRIHHGLVICATGKAATDTLPTSAPSALSELADAVLPSRKADQPKTEAPTQPPSMVAFEVVRTPDNALAVKDEGQTVPLEEALHASHRKHQLVMLSLQEADIQPAARLIRSSGMRHQAVIVASNESETRAALKADRSLMVAIPVRSTRDQLTAHRLAGQHPYAEYLPANASPTLFATAHREADVVIADSPDPQDNPKAIRALLREPVDIVVTSAPDHFAHVLGES
ncbi:hypothetical protein [Acetobacter estunensis]|uniref:hypothetical protein n=1 Tax=Acetobacter estunensis TaxID=104097 RepID=UPI001C2CE89D|nr:hypothetical protein [Acetobacter estunensis]MBV1838210.1 hypothetical protein [Acetobacter estunensis]